MLNLSVLLEGLMANGEFPAGREAEFRKYFGRSRQKPSREHPKTDDLRGLTSYG
ncbi:MAG: hypothetical protein WA261_06995 [Candidatus Sulfotelmatobacter sp.]